VKTTFTSSILRPTRTYWNDFVFEGYVNHRTEAIYLADVPESRPHSGVNSRRFRR